MLVVAAIAGGFAVAEMTVTGGLTPYQVLQCDASGVASVSCEGACSGQGAASVRGRVMKAGQPVFDWKHAGEASAGAWKGTLTGIPAGGPYTIEWMVGEEKCGVSDVLVGDLWVLAGQSNMQGVGNMIDVQDPDPLVHMLAMNHEWRIAREPLHILAESPDPVHFKPKSDEERQVAIENHKKGTKGAGLGLPFAVEMTRRTGRPVGLVCTAHGGTSMDQWSPSLKDQGGESLYGSMLKQVEVAGGKVRGVLWYQAESDANPEKSAEFKQKFIDFVAAIREDFGDPNLPFYYVQIGRFVTPSPTALSWNRIQQLQLECEALIPNSGVVASIDLALDDLIHAGTPGLKTLGARLASLAERDLYGGKTLRGPRPVEVTRRETPYGKQMLVKFREVNGRLVAPGRPAGFFVTAGPEGAPVPTILNQEISSESPDTVILWYWQDLPEDAQLWYGWGFDPYCNISDEAGMAVPVFGPMPIP